MATITALSSRGQIVLPIALRKRMGLVEGTQFMVLSDRDNILLKPVKEPSLDEFYALMEEAQRAAAEAGLTSADITQAIKAVRAAKRNVSPQTRAEAEPVRTMPSKEKHRLQTKKK